MGFLDKLAGWLGFRKKQVTVLCVGLDNSGKTTVINHFKPPQARMEEIVPTIGYSIEKIVSSNIQFTVFDMSGQGRYRNLWEQYCCDAEAIIFVVDSNDKLRTVVARDELEGLLKHPDIARRVVPVCCLANKKDLPEALSEVQVAEKMGLDEIKNKPYAIFATNALTGEGLDSAMDWLSEQITQLKSTS